MPNLIAHLGVGAIATRTVNSTADVNWIALGCVIPDVPWILQRLVAACPIELDPLSVRLYAVAQASLLGCAILAAALSFTAARPIPIFSILLGNCVAHLLLDGVQTKWANGVHLFSPVDWRPWNAELFWPESWATLLLTIFGLVYFLYVCCISPGSAIRLSCRRWTSKVLAMTLVIAYFAFPFAVLNDVDSADNHFARTLRLRNERLGRTIEFDRSHAGIAGDKRFIRAFTGERLDAVGHVWECDGQVSVRGEFVDEQTVLVHQYHQHVRKWRDFASFGGLLLVAAAWISRLKIEGLKATMGVL